MSTIKYTYTSQKDLTNKIFQILDSKPNTLFVYWRTINYWSIYWRKEQNTKDQLIINQSNEESELVQPIDWTWTWTWTWTQPTEEQLITDQPT